MRKKYIRVMQEKLNDDECIIINKCCNIQYFYNIELVEGLLLITNKTVYLISKYYVSCDSVEMICTNEISISVKKILIDNDIMYLHYDENYTYSSILKSIPSSCMCINDYSEEYILKNIEDFECLQINSIILKKVIHTVIDSIYVGKEIANICREYKSIAYSYEIQDCFISIMPARMDMANNEPFVKEGLIYLLDCGIKYRGIFSDFACTFKAGEYTEEEMLCLNCITAIQEKISKEIRAGVGTKQVIDKVLSVVILPENAKISNGFGHSVGIEIHEKFSLYAKKDFCFLQNMIFTIEPTLIYKDLSMFRLESTYMLRGDNVENPFVDIPYINIIERGNYGNLSSMGYNK